ncbi:MAG: flagellar basal body P-ring formation protein FlgA [Verrucomicrobia bacterium]|nr:flagellar basal body P-ring formation protein FlgA [Verrucomicrobiota bacterium]
MLNRAFLVLPVLWSLAARADALELKPQAEVDVQGIFLDQIVAGQKTEQMANILLAPAPAWGQTRLLKRAEITQILIKANPLLAANNLAGAPEVKVTRQSRKLAPEELLQLLTKKFTPKGNNERDGKLELRFTREWRPVSVPVEPIDLRIVFQPNNGPTANFMVRFEILCGAELITTSSATLSGRLLRNVWIAQSSIKRGTGLDAADIIEEERDILTLPQPVWTGRRDGFSQLSENIQAGGIIYARAIQQRPVVQRGQPIQAVAVDGPLTVSIRAEALEDGAINQIIRARNIRTQKVVRGKVINEDTIEVLF